MRKQRVEIRSYRGRRWKTSVWTAGTAALAAVGSVLVLISGMRFCGILALEGAAACLLGSFLQRWDEPLGRRCYRAFLALLCAGAVLFAVMETVVVTHIPKGAEARPADAVIVLGAGVRGEEPTLILQTRIDKAAEYLRRHPETKAVLTGGKGTGERLSEAEVMRRGLTAQGIAEDRLILEERSTSTAENFRYSMAALEQLDLHPQTLAVVTNGFHCYRAQIIARRVGVETFAVPAEIPYFWLEANCTVREAFALVKTLIFD